MIEEVWVVLIERKHYAPDVLLYSSRSPALVYAIDLGMKISKGEPFRIGSDHRDPNDMPGATAWFRDGSFEIRNNDLGFIITVKQHHLHDEFILTTQR